MIQVAVRKGLLGTDGIERVSVDARPGLTPRRLAHQLERFLPKSVPIECLVNGCQLPDEALDLDLQDQDQVLLVPTTSSGIEIGVLLVQALIAVAVSFAVNYVLALLLPRPKPDAARRGEDSSATYAWDGISTSYGQGLVVPWVYGRHAVGGQVIYTDVFANTSVNPTGTTDGAPDDKLRLVLALGEGPIAAVGDTPAAEIDGIGIPPAAALPSEIRINGTLLENTTTARTLRQILGSRPWVGARPIVGDILLVTDPTVTIVRGTVQLVAINNPQGTDVDVIELSVIPPAVSPLGSFNDYLTASPGYPTALLSILSSSDVVRVTRNPGARAWIRPGDLDQTPLPASTFRGSATTFLVNAQLNNVEEGVYTFSTDDETSSVGFTLAFPSGLYAVAPTGTQLEVTVQFESWWRPVGTTAWRRFFTPGTNQNLPILQVKANRLTPIVQSFAASLVGTSSPAVVGSIEVRLLRLTPSGGTDTSSAAFWRNVTFGSPQPLAYPRVALLGLELTAGARFSGGLPNVTCRIDGLLVRVWDEVLGFSPRTWDVPAAPFDFQTYPPGRNPAWILLDLLTSPWGLGHYLGDPDLDLPAFRRWSAKCDQDPCPADPWDEPSFTCDLVGDEPRPAWEWVLAICAAGRATPIYRDGKISITYQYRDAHSDAGISVPAKTATQLITAGNCEDVQITWLPKANRFTVTQFQFVDEAQNYAQDVETVPDTESTMDDPSALRREEWRPQTIQAYGVTRRSQLWREGIFGHRLTRLVRREIAFSTGPWALAAEVGEVIAFEHEILRPFAAAVPVNMLVVQDATAVNQITVDHDATGATEIVVRSPDGSPIKRTITSIVVSHGISSLTVSGAPVTVKKGATCVVGLTDKLTEEYELVAISLQKDLRRLVRAIQWVPEVHEPLTFTEYQEWLEGDEANLLLRQTDPEVVVQAGDLRVFTTRQGHSITWSRPQSRASAAVRVLVEQPENRSWIVVGETAGDQIDWQGFVPGVSYRIAVVLQQPSGEWDLPESSPQLTLVGQEFAPFSPQQLSNVLVLDAGDHVLVSWDPQGARDVEGYELRVGSDWASARQIYSGQACSVRLTSPPLGGVALLAARGTSGLFGEPQILTLPDWKPLNTVQASFVNEFASTPGGVHSGTAFGSSVIALSGSGLEGTYTSVELDLTYQATAWWQVSVDQLELDLVTVDEIEFEVGSGEAKWRTVNTRPASPASAGIDWETTVDDLAVLVEDLPSSRLAGGIAGEPGSHTRVLVESRFYVSGAWTSWSRHGDQWRAASKMQARLTLGRESTRYETSVSRLRLAANL